jgi:predicted ATPase
MIDSISVDNFKSLLKEDLKLTALNVLSGINGSGKSTLCQVILLLKEFVEHYKSSESTANLNNQYMQLGKIRDILHEGAPVEKINISLLADGNNAYFEFNADKELFANNYIPVTTKKLGIDTVASEPLDIDALKKTFRKIKYLRAERVGPRVVQEKDDYTVRMLNDIGISGEYVNSYLEYYGLNIVDFEYRLHRDSESAALAHQVSLWLKEICPNISFATNELSGTDFVGLQYQFPTKLGYSQEIRATNVGFGISYILPVIVICLAAEPGDVVIIDTPEAHLHPKGQAKIGELLAKTAADGVQVIVETHSDHVINGIRKQVVKKQIAPEDTTFYYFQLETGQEVYSPRTVIHKPVIDHDGMFDKWPEGFFDEWSLSLSELIKLRGLKD